MAAAVPVGYQKLSDVQQKPAYTGLSDVQKAVVCLLFTFYEKHQYFTTEEHVRVADSLHTNIDRALKTLYYTGGPAPAAGNDFMATLSIIIEFENDDFFTKSIGNGSFLVAMGAIRTLYQNQRHLPVFLPVTVVPLNGPNIWVAEEHRLVDSISQEAYDAANDVDDAKQQGITLGQETLRRYIRIMNRELAKSVWGKLDRHAADNPEARAAYDLSRDTIKQGVTNATDMHKVYQRSSLPRGVKGGITKPSYRKGGKQPSKRRTMRRQQYKRRRRTLHRR